MFQLMLNRHPAIHIPGETWFLSDLMDQLPASGALSPEGVQSAERLIAGHWRWQEWGIEESALTAAIGALESPDLASLIDAVYRLPMERAGKTRWGDKTPGYATEVARLHRVFPDAKFLHLIRDGRDVVTSLRRTGWHGERSWTIAQYWADSVASARRDGGALPEGQYHEVMYEELVLDTEPVLRGACEFLEEAFHPEMLSFHEAAGEHIPGRAASHLSKAFRPPRESDVQRWRNEMAFRHLILVEAFAGKTLQDAGYDRGVRLPLGWARLLCRTVDWGSEVTLPLRRRLGLHFPKARREL